MTLAIPTLDMGVVIANILLLLAAMMLLTGIRVVPAMVILAVAGGFGYAATALVRRFTRVQ
jgi:hypothetical protein